MLDSTLDFQVEIRRDMLESSGGAVKYKIETEREFVDRTGGSAAGLDTLLPAK